MKTLSHCRFTTMVDHGFDKSSVSSFFSLVEEARSRDIPNGYSMARAQSHENPIVRFPSWLALEAEVRGPHKETGLIHGVFQPRNLFPIVRSNIENVDGTFPSRW